MEQEENSKTKRKLYTEQKNTVKFRKLAPGLIFILSPFWRGLHSGGGGLSTDGNLRFKIDWVSLIVRRKFTIFALYYFLLEGNFQVQAPGGLIFGGVI